MMILDSFSCLSLRDHSSQENWCMLEGGWAASKKSYFNLCLCLDSVKHRLHRCCSLSKYFATIHWQSPRYWTASSPSTADKTWELWFKVLIQFSSLQLTPERKSKSLLQEREWHYGGTPGDNQGFMFAGSQRSAQKPGNFQFQGSLWWWAQGPRPSPKTTAWGSVLHACNCCKVSRVYLIPPSDHKTTHFVFEIDSNFVISWRLNAMVPLHCFYYMISGFLCVARISAFACSAGRCLWGRGRWHVQPSADWGVLTIFKVLFYYPVCFLLHPFLLRLSLRSCKAFSALDHRCSACLKAWARPLGTWRGWHNAYGLLNSSTVTLGFLVVRPVAESFALCWTMLFGLTIKSFWPRLRPNMHLLLFDCTPSLLYALFFSSSPHLYMPCHISFLLSSRDRFLSYPPNYSLFTECVCVCVVCRIVSVCARERRQCPWLGGSTRFVWFAELNQLFNSTPLIARNTNSYNCLFPCVAL